MVDNVKLSLQGFRGPLFLIGMPRSGTKLLRSLLNEHPCISLPDYETEFFPYWVNNWSEFHDLSDYKNFKVFYLNMLKAPYFNYCEEGGSLIEVKDWYDSCVEYTSSGVFEALLRHDVKANFNSDVIWGDKSPSYIISLKLIKQQFPEARFVHIVRDVRDYCLSINHAWKKNMVRAAQRWHDNISDARVVAKNFPSDYIEVRYEDLIVDPERELKVICAFLNTDFNSEMLSLSKPTENIGATKGQSLIISSNKMKYIDLMPDSLQVRIESITNETLQSLNYPVSTITASYRVPSYMMFIYKVLDGANLFFSTVKRIGVLGTIKYVYGALKVSDR